jgi:hypothetical protein
VIDKATAEKMVADYVNASYHVDGDELIVVDEATIEKDYGWVFFYTSRRFIETGDICYVVAGNGPILVDRQNGTLIQLGTALPVEEYIEQYEANRR